MNDLGWRLQLWIGWLIKLYLTWTGYILERMGPRKAKRFIRERLQDKFKVPAVFIQHLNGTILNPFSIWWLASFIRLRLFSETPPASTIYLPTHSLTIFYHQSWHRSFVSHASVTINYPTFFFLFVHR